MKDNYKLDSNQKIKEALVKACNKSRPSYFNLIFYQVKFLLNGN